MITAAIIIDRLRERGLLEVARKVAAEHYVTIGQVCGRSRSATIVAGRHAVWSAIRELSRASYPEIGAIWDVHHTSVMHGVCKSRPRLRVA